MKASLFARLFNTINYNLTNRTETPIGPDFSLILSCRLLPIDLTILKMGDGNEAKPIESNKKKRRHPVLWVHLSIPFFSSTISVTQKCLKKQKERYQTVFCQKCTYHSLAVMSKKVKSRWPRELINALMDETVNRLKSNMFDYFSFLVLVFFLASPPPAALAPAALPPLPPLPPLPLLPLFQ